MNKSVFRITRMDCASEEQMIRMTLADDTSVEQLEFDIPNRKLTVYHKSEPQSVADKIKTLNLGSTLLETSHSNIVVTGKPAENEKELLWAVLAINFFFFLLEVATGLMARSMGLIADSLDMLADSLVYGLSLYAVGGTVIRKKNIARASGVLQIILALLGFSEVVRRFLGYEDMPDFGLMIIVSLIALIGNSICLLLLQKSKSNDAHMRASVIFTSNDVIINIGVILAAITVYLTHSNKPDLLIGTIVFIIVFRGAFRILKLSK